MRQCETAVLAAVSRHAGYVTDGTARPDTNQVICRGEPPDPARPGIAWSSDPEAAIGYPRRHSTTGPTRVLQATASPLGTLACFTSEGEVVAEPDPLIDIKPIGQFPHRTPPNPAPGLHHAAFGRAGQSAPRPEHQPAPTEPAAASRQEPTAAQQRTTHGNSAESQPRARLDLYR